MTAKSTIAGCALASGLGLLAASCGGSGGGVLTDTGLTLADLQAQIFSPSCALSGCHNEADAQLGLDLSSLSASRASLINVPAVEVGLLRVEPFDSANSYLFIKVSGGEGMQGDQMPAEGGPLSAGQQNLIADWIDQGAL